MRKYLLIIVLFLMFALAILGGYYYYHKPIALSEAAAPVTALFNLAAAVLLGIFTGGLGRRLVRSDRFIGLTRLALDSAIGIGFTSLFWLLLGFLGLYRTWLAWLLLAAGLILLRRSIRSWLQDTHELADIWRSASRFDRLLLSASALLALNHLWIALAPPVKYDALTYHLQLPRLYLAAGRFTFEPSIVYWGHPQVTEMLYTWAMSLATPTAAGAFGWLVGLILVVGIVGLSRALFPGEETKKTSAACLTAFLMLAAPTVRGMMGWSYTDLFSALFGVGAFAAFFSWQSTGHRSWLYWLGLMVGFAVGTKYTAGILALALYPALLIFPGRSRPSFRDLLFSGLLALLVFAPWAVKNLAYTSNPVFPYFFPTQYYSAARLEMAHVQPDPIGWINSLFAPFWLTWQGVDSAPGPGSDIGPLLILFAIPGLIAFRRSNQAKPLAFAFFLTWLVIVLGGARIDHLRQTRLYFVILLPVLGIAGGWGWAALKDISAHGIRLSRLSNALILLVMFLTLWQDTLETNRTAAPQVLIGLESPGQYLDRNTGVYIDAMRRLDDLPSRSRVIMLWEGRGLYAPLGILPDPWIDRWRVDIREFHSAQVVLSNWRHNGYTHLLLFKSGMEFVRNEDTILSTSEWTELDHLLASLSSPVIFPGGYYELYSIPLQTQ